MFSKYILIISFYRYAKLQLFQLFVQKFSKLLIIDYRLRRGGQVKGTGLISSRIWSSVSACGIVRGNPSRMHPTKLSELFLAFQILYVEILVRFQFPREEQNFECKSTVDAFEFFSDDSNHIFEKHVVGIQSISLPVVID